ncbi:MAG: uroporphyrinogen-III synthase [Planctomycetes bacterium]|nr:uroporphyrinogen-III synthase [Planctomycetota bacterium]
MDQKTPGRLAGLRIAVTREEPGELAGLLGAERAEVIHCSLIRIVGPIDATELDTCLDHIGDYAWITFTSSNALRMTIQRGRALDGPSVACVGESTAATAREAGLQVALIPERRHVKGLIEAMAAQSGRGRVLYPRSDIAPGTLKEGLQALGYQVDDPVAYGNEPDMDGVETLGKALEQGLDAIVFASPSAVRAAIAPLGHAGLSGLQIYSIGPTTSAAIRENGLQVAGEAAGHTLSSLVDAVIEGQRNG